jgi:hypothetical protein
VVWNWVATESPHDSGAPQQLALDDLKAWTLRCGLVDLALLGVVRGGLLFSVAAFGCCCWSPSLPDGGIRSTLPQVHVPLYTKLVAWFLTAILGFSIAKAAASHSGNCSGAADATSPWVHDRQRTDLVVGSAAAGLLQLLVLAAHVALRRRALALDAAKQVSLQIERQPLLQSNDPNSSRQRPSNGQGPLRRLIGMMEPEKSAISLGMVALVISSLANLAVPAVAGSIVGAISEAQQGSGNSTHQEAAKRNEASIKAINHTVLQFVCNHPYCNSYCPPSVLYCPVEARS